MGRRLPVSCRVVLTRRGSPVDDDGCGGRRRDPGRPGEADVMHPSHQPQPPLLPYPLPPGHPTANDYGPPVDAPHLPATQSYPPYRGPSEHFHHPRTDAPCCPPSGRAHDGWGAGVHDGRAHGHPCGAHGHDDARSPRQRTTAGVLQIIGGWAGIGRFYAGDPRRGGIHLALFSSGIVMPQLALLSVLMIGYGVVDGIQILMVNTRDSEGRLLSE